MHIYICICAENLHTAVCRPKIKTSYFNSAVVLICSSGSISHFLVFVVGFFCHQVLHPHRPSWSKRGRRYTRSRRTGKPWWPTPASPGWPSLPSSLSCPSSSRSSYGKSLTSGRWGWGPWGGPWSGEWVCLWAGVTIMLCERVLDRDRVNRGFSI